MDTLDPLTRAVLSILTLFVLVTALIFPIPSGRDADQDKHDK